MAINFGNITTHVNDGSGTWVNVPTGQAASAQNTDIFLSSTGSRARKVSNTTKGYAFQVNASGRDMSAEIVGLRWQVSAGIDKLPNRSGGGVALLVMDTSGNVSFWDLDGGDTYTGGWKLSVVDLATTPTRNNGTNATLTLIEYVGLSFVFNSAVGGGDPNTYIDHILSWPNTGVTVTGNSTALIPDLVAEDDLSLFGIFELREEIIFSKTPIDLQPDASDMSSTGDTLVFENPTYDDGTNISASLGKQGLLCTDSDNVTLTRATLIASLGDETISGTDCSREFDIDAATDFDLDTVTLRGFTDLVSLGGSGQSLDFVQFNNCAKVSETGAVMRGITFRNQADVTGAFEWDETTDLIGADFFSPAAGNHGSHFTHNSATNLTGGSAITMDGINYNDYGAADTSSAEVDVDPDTSSIDIDFTIQNSASPTLDERSPYTGSAQTIQTVTLKVSVTDEQSVAIPYASVSIQDPADDSEISAGVANNLGVYTDSTFNYTVDTGVNVVVRRSSPGAPRYKATSSPQTITSIGLNAGVGLALQPFAGLLPMVGIMRHGVQSEDINDTGINISIDVPAGVSRKLFVCVAYWDSSTNIAAPTTAEYDGNAMTAIAGASAFVQEGSEFHEISSYRHDIPDGDLGAKTVAFVFPTAVNIKAVGFVVMEDVATGAQEDAGSATGNAVTSNPSLTLNNTTADAWSIGFALTDDLDSPTATGDAANRIRRSDLLRDGLLNSLAIFIAERTGTGSHNVGADFGSNSKSYVSGGATFAKL